MEHEYAIGVLEEGVERIKFDIEQTGERLEHYATYTEQHSPLLAIYRERLTHLEKALHILRVSGQEPL